MLNLTTIHAISVQYCNWLTLLFLSEGARICKEIRQVFEGICLDEAMVYVVGFSPPLTLRGGRGEL